MSLRNRPPFAVLIFGMLGVAFVVVPLAGLLQRAPWSGLGEVLGRPAVLDALKLSLATSLIALGVSLLLGVPLAWLLARTDFPGRSVVRAIVTLPMVLPPVVGGAALLYGLGRRGLVGQYLDRWFGLTIPYSPAGVVMAQTFVAMPFLVVTVEAGLRTAGTRYEAAASTLGASRWTSFRRVTLPLIAPSMLAGGVLCWARALGEFGATIAFNGNLQGRTQTLPLAIYLGLQNDRDSAIAMSLVLIAISLAVLVGLRDRWFGLPT